jgi:hypothetical protein
VCVKPLPASLWRSRHQDSAMPSQSHQSSHSRRLAARDQAPQRVVSSTRDISCGTMRPSRTELSVHQQLVAALVAPKAEPSGPSLTRRCRCCEVCFCTAAENARRCQRWVCAVIRRRFPVGASPTRQPLQPEATGAVMEATKWLKPSVSVSRIGDSASVQAVTRVNAEQASKRTMRRPTRRPFRGRLIRLGE